MGCAVCRSEGRGGTRRAWTSMDTTSACHSHRHWLAPTPTAAQSMRRGRGVPFPACVRRSGVRQGAGRVAARIDALIRRPVPRERCRCGKKTEVWRSSRLARPLQPQPPPLFVRRCRCSPAARGALPRAQPKKNHQNRGSRPCALTPIVRNVVGEPDSTRGEADCADRSIREVGTALYTPFVMFFFPIDPQYRSRLSAVAQHATALCTVYRL